MGIIISAKTKQFISRSRVVHGDGYDYSLSVYERSNKKLIIICNVHGKFQRIPNDHISKACGCPKCAKEKRRINNKTKYTTEWFIKKAKQVHGSNYRYTNTEYVNVKTKILVNCIKHDDFYIWPSDHMNGIGCKKCGIETVKQKLQKNTDIFIRDAITKHGDRYDYTNVVYINHKKDVEIICNVHGKFFQKPYHHLFGSGCKKCGNMSSGGLYSTPQFIEMSVKKHKGKYDYGCSVYISHRVDIKIECPIHGYFKQKPYIHLQGSGCPKCSKNNFSKVAIEWLESISEKDSIFIQHALNEGEFRIPDTKYKVDGYCKETNTVYEFYGDCWHGNLNKYKPTDKCHPFSNLTALELNTLTMNRENIILNMGYNLTSIWEDVYCE